MARGPEAIQEHSLNADPGKRTNAPTRNLCQLAWLGDRSVDGPKRVAHESQYTTLPCFLGFWYMSCRISIINSNTMGKRFQHDTLGQLVAARIIRQRLRGISLNITTIHGKSVRYYIKHTGKSWGIILAVSLRSPKSARKNACFSEHLMR